MCFSVVVMAIGNCNWQQLNIIFSVIVIYCNWNQDIFAEVIVMVADYLHVFDT